MSERMRCIWRLCIQLVSTRGETGFYVKKEFRKGSTSEHGMSTVTYKIMKRVLFYTESKSFGKIVSLKKKRFILSNVLSLNICSIFVWWELFRFNPLVSFCRVVRKVGLVFLRSVMLHFVCTKTSSSELSFKVLFKGRVTWF